MCRLALPCFTKTKTCWPWQNLAGFLPSLAGGFLEHTLLALVRKHYPEATPMHRLGRGTSGVVLFARTARARSALCAAFRRKEVTQGLPGPGQRYPFGGALFSSKPPSVRCLIHVLAPSTRPAPPGSLPLSRVSILERRTDASLLEVTIETGRPHQIRIHLAAAGHPLVGDPLYTDGGGLKERRSCPPRRYRLSAPCRAPLPVPSGHGMRPLKSGAALPLNSGLITGGGREALNGESQAGMPSFERKRLKSVWRLSACGT